MAAAKKRSTKNKNNSPVTVSELKALLEGIEILQGDEFVPTGEQWARIREKIMLLEDSGKAPPTPAPQQAAPRVQMPNPALTAPATSTLTDPAQRVNPQPLNPNSPLANGGSPDQPFKTPNIDTSKTGYNPDAFE